MEPGRVQIEEISIHEYWRVIVRRRKLVLYMTGAAFALSILVSLVLPKTYAATARVLPPPQKSSSGSALLAGIAAYSEIMQDGLLDTNKSSELWAEILASQSVQYALVKKFGLREAYGKKTDEEARTGLEKRVSIKKSKAGIVSVTVEDRLPQRAADMANAFMEELDRVNKNLGMSTGTRTRLFLEKRLEETKAKLTEAEKALNSFQRANSALKLDEQSGAVIKAIGEAKGDLMAKEVELHAFLSYATEDNPKAAMLKAQIAGLRREIGRMEVSDRGIGSGDVFIPTSRFPDLNLQYARLVRELKIQQTLYESLLSQFEQAKIAEAKDSTTVQVLDKAPVPMKKIRPARVQIVILSTMLSAFVSVLAAFAVERLEGGRRLPA